MIKKPTEKRIDILKVRLCKVLNFTMLRSRLKRIISNIVFTFSNTRVYPQTYFHTIIVARLNGTGLVLSSHHFAYSIFPTSHSYSHQSSLSSFPLTMWTCFCETSPLFYWVCDVHVRLSLNPVSLFLHLFIYTGGAFNKEFP